MGVCTSDPLGYLTDKEGEKVCNYIVSIKSEQHLDIILPELSEKVHEQFTNLSNSLNRELDTREKAIKDFFDKILTQTQKQSKIALQNVKKRQQKSEKQLFGLDKIQQNFIRLRTDKDQKIRQNRNKVLMILQQKKNELQNSILKKRTKLLGLQEIPFWHREQVLKKAEERYTTEIQSRKEELQTILKKSTEVIGLQQTLRKSVGIDEADKLVRSSRSNFQRIKRSLTFSDNPRSCFG